MKKTALKRALALLAAIALVISVPVFCFADEDKTEETFETSGALTVGADGEDTLTVGADAPGSSETVTFGSDETGEETDPEVQDYYDYYDHLIDTTDTLTDQEIYNIVTTIAEAHRTSGVEFFFVMVGDFTSTSYGTYAEDAVDDFTSDIFCDEEIFGVNEETDSAAILLFSTETGDMCIFSTPTVYDAVKGEEKRIREEEIIPYVSDGRDDYYSAAIAFIVGYSGAVAPEVSVGAPGLSHVIDITYLISDEQIDQIDEAITKAREESGVDFYFVMVPDFTAYGYGEDDVEDFTMDVLFEEFGVSETDSAAILLFSTGYRDFCTYSTQPVYDVVKGGIEEYIEEYNILPNVKDGKDDYYSAALAFITEYSKVIKANNDGTLDRSLYKEPFGWFGAGIVSSIVGLLAGAIRTSSQKSKLKTVAFRNKASGYTVPGSLEVENKRDTFLYSTVSRVYVEPASRSSGGGGSSFSGGSHGGGGRSGKY